MGQTLERFSSVSEEKKNKEIERIVEKVYKDLLEEKPIPQPSNQTEGNKESNEALVLKSTGNPQPSNQTEGKKQSNGASALKSIGNPQPSNQTEGNKESNGASVLKSIGKPQPSNQTEGNKKSNEASEKKAKFYRAVCEIVGELNKTFGNTQFKVPSIKNLEKAFKDHHSPTKPVTKEDFQRMLQDVLKTESVFPGFGAKDALVYIFTVPAAAVLAKQRFFPRAIPNDVLIPGFTSATVFALAKLNKI